MFNGCCVELLDLDGADGIPSYLLTLNRPSMSIHPDTIYCHASILVGWHGPHRCSERCNLESTVAHFMTMIPDSDASQDACSNESVQAQSSMQIHPIVIEYLPKALMALDGTNIIVWDDPTMIIKQLGFGID